MMRTPPPGLRQRTHGGNTAGGIRGWQAAHPWQMQRPSVLAAPVMPLRCRPRAFDVHGGANWDALFDILARHERASKRRRDVPGPGPCRRRCTNGRSTSPHPRALSFAACTTEATSFATVVIDLCFNIYRVKMILSRS